MEEVMRDSATPAEEEANTLRWLNGDTNRGRWPDASRDWQHLFAMRTTDLVMPFTVPVGPVEGCGMTAPAVVVDNQNRILTWAKTRFPTLTGTRAFGTNYAIDLVAIDQKTGRRVPIDNGGLSGMWMIETDNLYALSVAGDEVWLRQNFRGTQTLDLRRSLNRMVSNTARDHDGAFYTSDIIYAQTPESVPSTNQRALMGRVAPAFANGFAYISESFGITAIESIQPRTSAALDAMASYGAAVLAEEVSGSVTKMDDLSFSARIDAPLTKNSGTFTPDPYLWQFPSVSNLSGANAQIMELQEQVQAILDAGSLAPLYLKYGDIIDELYYLYDDPGRIITTLAWAYPHVTSDQKTSIRTYVAAQLASPSYSPWAENRLSVKSGVPREYHPMEEKWRTTPHEGLQRPRVHNFHGLWLYAYRSNDWQLLEKHWPAIKSGYERFRNELDLFGTVQGAIGMVRMSHALKDNAMMTRAEQDARQALSSARNFDTFWNAAQKYYPEMYANRRSGDLLRSWSLLNLSPEMGRFLGDHHRTRILDTYNTLSRQYPHWWLMQAPYFTRWTGDESIGLTPEIFGIMAPLQRYVLKMDGPTLRQFLRSSPTGIGDSFWMEALVYAIEAHGSTRWVDVRNPEAQPPDQNDASTPGNPPVLVNPAPATPADTIVTIYVDGNRLHFPDAQPFIDTNSRTLIPVRFLAQAYGAIVDWDQERRTAIIGHEGNRLLVTIGQSTYLVNGQPRQMDTQAVILHGRTHVPLRFVSEALGMEVDWSSLGGGRVIVYVFSLGQTEQERQAIKDAAISDMQGGGTAPIPSYPSVNLLRENFEREQLLDTTPGKDYKMTAWLRITEDRGNDWGGIRMAAFDQDWRELASVPEIRSATYGYEWFKQSITFTATSSQTRLQIEYFGGPGNRMTYQIRDVEAFSLAGNLPPQLRAEVRVDTTKSPSILRYSALAEDPDGMVTAIEWDFGDGGRAFTASGQRQVSLPGTYNGRIRISDDAGAVALQIFQWSVTDPHPAFTLVSSETSVVRQATIQLSGQIHRALQHMILSSDRGQIKTLPLTASGMPQPFHTSLPLLPGNNRILIQATDKAGNLSTREMDVTYLPVDPVRLRIRRQPESAKKWETLEIHFNIDNVAATHLQLPHVSGDDIGMPWIDGITVTGVFSPDNWKTTYERPAFFQQRYRQESKSGMDWLYPESESHWTLRFRPPHTGDWQYRIVATDKSGVHVTTGREIRVMEQDDPDIRGGLSVSQRDNRYFEYEDHSTFLGGGFSIGPDADRYATELERLFQQIGQDTPLLSRLWIAGQIQGSAWQPWASRTLGYDGTVPHSGLTLEQAYGDGLASLRLDADNPVMFQGFHSGRIGIIPGRRYQMIIRWRTQDIGTPIDPSLPHGAAVRLADWPEPGKTAGDILVIPHVAGTQPWHVATATFTANQQTSFQEHFLRNPAIVFENTRSGAVFVDEIRLHEVDTLGNLGPQLLRSPKFNAHLTYDPRQSAVLDEVIRAAEAHNQSIKFVISEKQDFLINHLSPQGLADPRGNHFNSPPASAGRFVHQSYWRYLSARYGASRAVHSWEVVNEEAPGPGPHFQMVNDFAEIARRDGNPQMVSTSTWATLAQDVWKKPDYEAISYTDFHAYVNSTGWLEPRTALTRDSAMLFSAYDHAAAQADLGKPVVWGEMGIDGHQGSDHEHADLQRDRDGVWLHKWIWARTGPGGVYPIYWYTGQIHQRQLYPLFSSWQRFMDSIPLSNGHYQDLEAVSSNQQILVLGQKDLENGRAHLWMTNQQHTWWQVVNGRIATPQSGTVVISMGHGNREYRLHWHDTRSGEKTHTGLARTDSRGEIVLQISRLQTDMALQIEMD